MRMEKRLIDHVGINEELHPFGYPSKHLAENAACRWFDSDQISFRQWEQARVVKYQNRFYVINPK